MEGGTSKAGSWGAWRRVVRTPLEAACGWSTPAFHVVGPSACRVRLPASGPTQAASGAASGRRLLPPGLEPPQGILGLREAQEVAAWRAPLAGRSGRLRAARRGFLGVGAVRLQPRVLSRLLWVLRGLVCAWRTCPGSPRPGGNEALGD